LKPKEYVRKYGFDRYVGFVSKDSKSEFLSDLANDFSTSVEYLATINQLSYERFKNCIKEIKQKWDSISNKMKGEGLSEGFWKYFFATVIVPMRDQMFGEYLKKKEDAWKQKKREREEFNKRYWGYAGGESEYAYHRRKADEYFGAYAFYNIWKRLMGDFTFGTTPTTKFEVLGISPEGATIETVNISFREKIRIYHPDKGGDKETAMALIEAKNECLKYLQSRGATAAD